MEGEGSPLASNQKDTRISSPFSWRGDSFPPILDSETPDHLEKIRDLGIPYIFDIHTHFFPETVMKLIWRWFDNVNWAIGYRLPEAERVKRLHHNGIKRFTTLNYAHKAGMASSLNDWTYTNYKNWEGAIPFGTFYPEEGVLGYVKKAVEDYGFSGFKLHCEVSKLNLNRPELADTFSYLQEKQIPILIHTGTAPLPGEFTGIEFFKPFLETYPKLVVIVAHMGAHEISAYASLLDSYPNLALDTTMVFVDFLATGKAEDVDFAVSYLETYQDQIYFGSDFPNIPYNLNHPISRLLELQISDLAKQKILYRNAESRFFK
ncbi:amidohydrolase family protein [Leptospira brenneri]|uniref:Amidohydrolase n=1 Tax=Leptospira brenneri TaxID=2023182 RepID=A0A2M9Y3N9_9LEPT|nr:amidohydrolase family protein [Leptospira brenneri]PJZ46157.1 metal-dependent hydrolase [Leptospira brenneri]TGK91268.1 amidohydrolase [Leptospira brenneri]